MVDNSSKRLVLAVALALLGGSAIAANRCVDAKGKVTYQDAACREAQGNAKGDISQGFSTRAAPGANPRAAAEPAPPTPTGASGGSGDYATFRGAWRGPMQFELNLNGARDGGAHAIAPTIVEIHPDGEVVGQASASGCVFSGLATQNVAPYMASLDVSLKSCKDPRFNTTRYNGNLPAIASAKEARLHLVGLVMKPAAPLTVQMQQVSLEAVLKR